MALRLHLPSPRRLHITPGQTMVPGNTDDGPIVVPSNNDGFRRFEVKSDWNNCLSAYDLLVDLYIFARGKNLWQEANVVSKSPISLSYCFSTVSSVLYRVQDTSYFRLPRGYTTCLRRVRDRSWTGKR